MDATGLDHDFCEDIITAKPVMAFIGSLAVGLTLWAGAVVLLF